MAPLDENAVDAALLRVCGADRSTRGTAFVIGEGGVALTCHHVVAGESEVHAETRNGELLTVTLLVEDLWPEFDLALLRCPHLRGPPLPVAAPLVRPDQFWTKGFQWQGANILAAVPLAGVVPGHQEGLAYTWGERDYEIPNVYVLSEEDIDHGLSGAPLIDRRWGVVFGVVNATLRLGTRRGYAIPIAVGTAHIPSLRALVDRNGSLVARFGPYLNARGAERICGRQLDAARERLATDKLVTLDRYAERPAVHAAVAEALAGGQLIVALVGSSGVGKTTELARLAHGLEGAVLMVQAADLSETNELAEALAARLAKDVGEDAALDNVLGALSDAPVVILLDGLNEASFASDVQTWFRRTDAWLRRHPARLVLTSRWEQWKRATDGISPPLRTIAMSDFTEAEASEARSMYGIPSSVAPSEIAHPLLARIYAESSREHGGPLTRYEAVEQYLIRKTASVGLAAGVDDLAVEAALDDLIAGLDAQTLRIDRQSVLQARAIHGNVVSVLVDESLIVRAGADFQFAFDEIAEYLQARKLGIDVTAAPHVLGPGPQEVASGSIVFGLLQLEREEGAAAVGERLSEMLGEIGAGRAVEAVVSLLAALSDPQPVVTALVREATAPEQWRRDEVLRLLWDIEPGAVPHPELLLTVLEDNVAAHPGDYWAAACMERWLNRADQAPQILPRTEALALAAIDRGGSLTPLAYAIGGLPGLSAPPEVRSRLLAAMLASPRAPAAELPEILARRLPEESWAVEQLLDSVEGAGEEMEHGLFRAAQNAPRFARCLAQHRFPAQSDALQRFFEKLDQGVAPEVAADAVMQDWLAG